MPYDPSLFRGSATHYVRGRPAYSRMLGATLDAELGLDGSGRLLDAGCGPGVLIVRLASLFTEAVGLDPDPDMLADAAARVAAAGIGNVRWVRAVAEDMGRLDLGTFRLVTFGQSFHWTDRQRVAELVYELLEPGGALAVIDHAHAGRPQPPAPEHPPIPHDAIRALIASYLGERRRAGQGFAPERAERNEDVIARTRFGRPRRIYAPGREDIVQDAEGVLSNYLSTSFCAPHLFGERLPAFQADVRAALATSSPTGLFWDWPGDTEILLARKPG